MNPEKNCSAAVCCSALKR